MVLGSWNERFPIVRRSWVWLLKWIIVPAQINSRALNIAWVIKWNIASFGKPKAILAIITPSCLKVDSAIIFFKSHSVIADRPAINIVMEAVINKVGWNHGKEEANGKNRISKKIPAVTRVDEWTSADTGVGAAIAAGSHLEKGICALLVIAASIIDKTI